MNILNKDFLKISFNKQISEEGSFVLNFFMKIVDLYIDTMSEENRE